MRVRSAPPTCRRTVSRVLESPKQPLDRARALRTALSDRDRRSDELVGASVAIGSGDAQQQALALIGAVSWLLTECEGGAPMSTSENILAAAEGTPPRGRRSAAEGSYSLVKWSISYTECSR